MTHLYAFRPCGTTVRFVRITKELLLTYSCLPIELDTSLRLAKLRQVPYVLSS